ncbi:unnamed protein product [Prunus armeniaca]
MSRLTSAPLGLSPDRFCSWASSGWWDPSFAPTAPRALEAFWAHMGGLLLGFRAGVDFLLIFHPLNFM